MAHSLVAARHMVHFGYKPVLVCVDGDRFEHLGTQVRQLGVPVRSVVEEGAPTPQEWKQCSFVVDAIFGFGFHGVVRAPWRPIVEVRSSPDRQTKYIPSIALSLSCMPLCVPDHLQSMCVCDCGEAGGQRVWKTCALC